MRRFAARVKRRVATHARFRRFRELARGGEAGREIAVVLGNCQAEPLAQLLRSGPVSERFEIVSIPPVHLIDADQTEALHHILRRAGLLVAQRVRDGYRGLEIGTAELERSLPDAATRVHFPVMYFEGLYPYQVYVRHRGDTSESAPRTSYADLRVIVAAARGIFGEEGVGYARSLIAGADSIRMNAERSLGFLREREVELDVAATDGMSGLSFHTVNHPSNELIRHVGDGVAKVLGTSTRHAVPAKQYLDDIYTPFEARVSDVLGIGAPERLGWRIHGHVVNEDDVFRAHLQWFRERPELIGAAVAQHGKKLETFGFEL